MDTTTITAVTAALALSLGACAPDARGAAAPLVLTDPAVDPRPPDLGVEAAAPSIGRGDERPPGWDHVDLAGANAHFTHRWVDPPRDIDGTLIDPQPVDLPGALLGGRPGVSGPGVPGVGVDYGGGASGGSGEGDGSGGTPSGGSSSGGGDPSTSGGSSSGGGGPSGGGCITCG